MSQSYYPGDSYYFEFTTTRFDTGAATNADSLPTATANKNGTDDGAFTLTVANIDAGRYKITGTVPTGYKNRDRVIVTVAATVNSVAGKGKVDEFLVEETGVTFGTVLASGGSTSTNIVSNSITGLVGSLNNRILVWMSGANVGQAHQVSGHSPGQNHFTISPASSNTPTDNDRFKVV